jgi:single-stranded DNA-binding protein
MSLDQWESNQGEPRSQILVTVSSLEFLGTKPKETDEFEQVVANEIPEPPEEIGLNNAQDANGEDNSELVASGNGSRKRKK